MDTRTLRQLSDQMGKVQRIQNKLRRESDALERALNQLASRPDGDFEDTFKIFNRQNSVNAELERENDRMASLMQAARREARR